MPFDWKLSVSAVLCCWIGCADFHRGPAPPDAGPVDTGPPADPIFESDVYPILQLNCQFCHRAGRFAENTPLLLTGDARKDRAMVVDLVTPGDPAESLLLRRATGEYHGGGNVLDPAGPEYSTIASWISDLPAEP
jgi:hypothetical protein